MPARPIAHPGAAITEPGVITLGPMSRLGLALSAAAFVAYPVLRPYSSETGLAGARAFASTDWLVAHLLGMLGFVGLVVATMALRAAARVQVAMACGVALLLPYYGAECFGLHALGRTVLRRDEPGLMSMADLVRYNPAALTVFGAGLLFVAVAGVAVGRHLWRAGDRVAAVLIAIGTVAYLPQFFGPPWVRIVHGGVLAAGLLLVGVGRWRRIAA